MEHISISAIRRISWRIVPLAVLGHFILHIDRQNVGFAALGMNPDLGLTAEMFGFGAGLFFFGYALF